MANEFGKAIDKTFLSIDQAETRGFLHRDYIAHCLRWTHVVKWISASSRYKTAKVLDIGCGKEMPLAKLLHSSRLAPLFYAAADVSKIEMPQHFATSTWKPNQLLPETDAALLTVDKLEQQPNVIVCFEVLEHIEPEHCRRMMLNFSKLIEPGGTVFLSTPCYDSKVGAAANHVNEMTYQAFGAALEDTGWRIQGHWGTFASIKDYKDVLTQDLKDLFDKFKGYYDSNYLATIFAPLYPQLSRNCIWELKFDKESDLRLFPSLKDVDGPWGSSDKWKELLT
jgi:2-polyprenyl-3-methyl-5-hydroxy-6-metoxy-1,4-benzoquinol methylase